MRGGEYIAYIDSDDFIDCNMLEKMYDLAKNNKSDIVICGAKVVSTDNKVLKEEPSILFNDTILDILYGKMAVWNKLYRKSLISKKNLEFRSKVWYEDIDFTAKALFDENIKIAFLNDNLYNYLLRPGSTMNNSNLMKNLDLLLSFDEIIEYFKQNNIYQIHYQKIEFLAVYHIFICGITRLINISDDKKLKKEIIKKYREYVIKKFPTYKNNEYLKYLDRNKKIIFTLVKLKLYFVIKIIFKIKG